MISCRQLVGLIDPTSPNAMVPIDGYGFTVALVK